MPKDRFFNLRNQLEKVLEHIDDEERDIVVMRFGISGNAPFTLKDVTTATGINNDDARLLEGAALRKLREYAVDHEDFYLHHDAKKDPFFADMDEGR